MKEKLEKIFDKLQTLDLKPTLTNMETLLLVLYELREIYNELSKEGEDDGRTPPDSEQQHSN